MLKLLRVFCKPKPLMHPLDDMSSTKYHIKQLERRGDPHPMEGEIVRGATPMKLVADRGEYYGLGHTVVDITDAP